MTRLFGFECELAGGGAGVLPILAAAGMIPTAGLHAYHCDCEDCAHNPDRHNPIAAQEDCTADAELITKPLLYGSDEADDVISKLADALRRGRATTGDGVGFHVHVNKQDLSHADLVNLTRLFLRYQDDIGELAATRFRDVRDYNAPLSEDMVARLGTAPSVSEVQAQYPYTATPEQLRAFWHDDEWRFRDTYARPGKGHWLNLVGRNTVEFRVWNATRVEWRMRLAVGVSVAMVEAAKSGLHVTPDTEESLIDVLAPFMDATTFAAVLRQSHVKELES